MNFRLLNRADWQRIVAYVRGLPWQRDGHGVAYRITIQELKSTRSIEQNNFYWALMTAISQQAPSHMGGEYHAPEVWAEYCKRRFLGMTAGPFGEGVAKSTRELRIGEFSDYLTQIHAWAIDQFPGFNFDYEEDAA